MDNQTRLLWLALALGPGVSGEELIELDSPAEAFKRHWSRRGRYKGWGEVCYPSELLRKMERMVSRLARLGARAVLSFDPEFPQRLIGIKRCPPVLFVQGAIPRGDAIAMVGSRGATLQGLQLARRIASDVARAGIRRQFPEANAEEVERHLRKRIESS